MASPGLTAPARKPSNPWPIEENGKLNLTKKRIRGRVLIFTLQMMRLAMIDSNDYLKNEDEGR